MVSTMLVVGLVSVGSVGALNGASYCAAATSECADVCMAACSKRADFALQISGGSDRACKSKASAVVAELKSPVRVARHVACGAPTGFALQFGAVNTCKMLSDALDDWCNAMVSEGADDLASDSRVLGEAGSGSGSGMMTPMSPPPLPPPPASPPSLPPFSPGEIPEYEVTYGFSAKFDEVPSDDALKQSIAEILKNQSVTTDDIVDLVVTTTDGTTVVTFSVKAGTSAEGATKAAAIASTLGGLTKTQLATDIGATEVTDITAPQIAATAASDDEEEDGGMIAGAVVAALVGVAILGVMVWKRACIMKTICPKKGEDEAGMMNLPGGSAPSGPDDNIQLTGSAKI